MLFKRILLILSIILITISCYIFMNRNYDPFARYPYDIEDIENTLIQKLDYREIAYIVDYQIAPEEFLPYINAYHFNIFHTSNYNKAKLYFYYLTDNQIVEVVEKALRKKVDIDSFLFDNSYNDYETIMHNLDK